MHINRTTQTNFQGGFKFPQMPIEARTELGNFITTHKQVFENFTRKGDVFLVTRDRTNFKVAEFIHNHNLRFEFYPSINTKCGLDTEKPEGLAELLSTIKEEPITSKTQLKKNLTRQKLMERIKDKSPQYIDNVLKALCIDNKHPIKNYNGISIISDNEFQRNIFITPPSKLKIHYVKVEPVSLDKTVERYAIDTDGNILAKFQTPDAIKTFNERFNKLIIK